jgi:hypothetical protein
MAYPRTSNLFSRGTSNIQTQSTQKQAVRSCLAFMMLRCRNTGSSPLKARFYYTKHPKLSKEKTCGPGARRIVLAFPVRRDRDPTAAWPSPFTITLDCKSHDSGKFYTRFGYCIAKQRGRRHFSITGRASQRLVIFTTLSSFRPPPEGLERHTCDLLWNCEYGLICPFCALQDRETRR